MVMRAPEWVFVLFVMGVGAAPTWEVARMFEQGGVPTYGRVGVLGAVGVTASFARPANALIPAFPTVVLTVAIAAVLSLPVWLGMRPTIEPVALTLLGVLYVGWFLGHAILLRQFVDRADLVLFLVGVTRIVGSVGDPVGPAPCCL